MVEIRYRIRKKGKYFQLDKLINGEVNKSWTLNPFKLAQMFECPTDNGQKVSTIAGEENKNEPQKFSQSSLNELPKTGQPTAEDVKNELNKLMKDIL